MGAAKNPDPHLDPLDSAGGGAAGPEAQESFRPDRPPRGSGVSRVGWLPQGGQIVISRSYPYGQSAYPLVSASAIIRSPADERKGSRCAALKSLGAARSLSPITSPTCSAGLIIPAFVQPICKPHASWEVASRLPLHSSKRSMRIAFSGPSAIEGRRKACLTYRHTPSGGSMPEWSISLCCSFW
jgi:hypothetical protein